MLEQPAPAGVREVIARAFAKQFQVQAFVQMLRELFRRDISAYGAYPIPLSYAKRIQSCTRIGRVIDTSGDVLDVIVVRVALPKTFERHHSQLHALAVQAARYWVNEPSFQALVIYEMPLLSEWRLQVVTSHVATERQPNNTFKPIKIVLSTNSLKCSKFPPSVPIVLTRKMSLTWPMPSKRVCSAPAVT
jgi:hypothetical protein